MTAAILLQQQQRFFDAVKNGRSKDILRLGKIIGDIDIVDSSGNYPIHYAPNEQILKLLVDFNCNVNVRDQFDNTPLHLAKNPAMQLILIEAGADVNAFKRIKKIVPNTGVTVKDKKFIIIENPDTSPIHCAKNLEMIKILKDAGADINAQDRFGHGLLHDVKDYETAKFLLENGIDVNLINNNNELAIHRIKDIQILELIVQDESLDINIQSKSGYTALFFQSYEITKLLLDNSIDPFIKDNEGKTAQDYATDPTIYNLLQKAMTNLAEGRDPLSSIDIESIEYNEESIIEANSVENFPEYLQN